MGALSGNIRLGWAMHVSIYKITKYSVIVILIIFFPDHVFLHYKPSEVAAAIVCVARISCRIGTAWTNELQKVTSYSLEHLQPIANNLLK